jgi:hypothetical protein
VTHVDKSDAEYLNQFPDYSQAQALRTRYELMKKAVRKDGNLRQNWNDHQNITVKAPGGSRTYSNINTKISDLVRKITDMGQNPATIPIPSMADAYQSIHYWRGMSGKRMERRGYGSSDLMHLPGSDVSLKSRSPMVPSNYWDRSNIKWNDEVKEELKPIVSKAMNYTLANIYQKHDGQGYLNYYYWIKPKNRKQLFQGLIDYIERVYKDKIKELIDNELLIRKIVNARVNTVLQGGFVSRRKIVASGLNVHELISQGWSPEEITHKINQDPSYQPVSAA